MSNALDRLLNSGWDVEATSPLLMRQVRSLTAGGLLLLLLGIPFLIRAYQWQIHFRMVMIPLALGIIVASLLLLRYQQRFTFCAHLSVFASYCAAFGALATGGGIAGITAGWILIVPLWAGILLGLRAALAWGGWVLLTNLGFFLLGTWGWDFSDQTPVEVRSVQNITQTLGLLAAVMICITSYLSQTGRSERELAQRNKQLEQEVQRAEQAEQATKIALDAKTRFLANMSHELRTPLNSVIGFSQRLMTHAADKLEQRELDALNQVMTNGQQMESLVADLLRLADIDQKQIDLVKTEMRLDDIFTRLQTELSPLADQYGLGLRCQTDVGILVCGDPEKLTIAFSSVVKQGIKMAEQGDVCLMAQLRDDTTVSVEMRYQGAQLSEQEHARLFDRYNHLHSKTDRNVFCSGLALVLAAEYVFLHDGCIHSSSIMPSGVSIEILLPLPQKPADI